MSQVTYYDHRNAVTLAYASNDVNEYTSIEDVGAAGNPITVLYDAAGNLSRDDDEYEYTYDYENRLTQIDYAPTVGASTRLAHFAYDALGRMISSQLRFDADINGRTETLKYTYDGVNVVAEYDEWVAWANLFARDLSVEATGKLSLAHATPQFIRVGVLGRWGDGVQAPPGPLRLVRSRQPFLDELPDQLRVGLAAG